MTPRVDVWHGDAMHLVDQLPDRSVGVVATSPPYWANVDYRPDDPAEQGRSGTPLAVWVAQLVATFDRIRPKLADDAAVWVNLGDAAVGSGGSGGDYYNAAGTRAGRPKFKQGYAGLPKQGFALAPERFAIAMQDAGWRVRSAITWDRSPVTAAGGQYLREQAKHVKRPLRAAERIYLLGHNRVALPRFDHEALLALPESERGDVWHFPPARGKGRQARYPVELPARCLTLTPANGDVVLDPYAGEGTTGQAAVAVGADSVLIDLDPAAVRVDRLTRAGARVHVNGLPVAGYDTDEWAGYAREVA